MFRAVADAELLRQPALAAQLRAAHEEQVRAATWSGWAASWFVAAPAASAESLADEASNAQQQLSDGDWSRIYASLGVDDEQKVSAGAAASDSGALPQRHVLRVDVASAAFALLSDESPTVTTGASASSQLVEASMKRGFLRLVDVRGGLQADIDVEQVAIADHTVRNSAFPMLVTTVDAEPDATAESGDTTATAGAEMLPLVDEEGARAVEPLLRVRVGIGALASSADCDASVLIRVRAVRAVLHTPLLRALWSFADDCMRETRDAALLYALELEAARRMAQWGTSAADNLANTLAQSKRIAVSIDVHAPTLILPLIPSSHSSPALHIDLGRLRIANADETTATPNSAEPSAVDAATSAGDVAAEQDSSGAVTGLKKRRKSRRRALSTGSNRFALIVVVCFRAFFFLCVCVVTLTHTACCMPVRAALQQHSQRPLRWTSAFTARLVCA